MASRVNIMHLVYCLETGGMENGVVNLCNGLDTRRFSPSICTMKAGGPLEKRVDQDRVGLFTVRRHMGNDPSVPPRLAWLLRRCHVDILHTHNWVTLVEGSIAASMARVPHVIHGEHGYPMEERWRNVRVQRWFWSRASRLTSVSDELADRMAQLAGIVRHGIHVIPNGVDTAKFRPIGACKSELRRQLGLSSAGLLFGVVARLDPVKNHAGIIDSVTTLCRQGIDAHLAVAGDGPLRSELIQRTRDLEVTDRVHFLGNVSRVERLLNALDVFVLNSNFEGMSNTVIEAMACGVPVIATRVGSNPRSVEHEVTGLLIEPRDSEGLAQAMQRMSALPEERRRYACAARQRIETHFALERMVGRYEALYNQCELRGLGNTKDDVSVRTGS